MTAQEDEKYYWDIINNHSKYVKTLEQKNMFLEDENSYLSDLVDKNKKLREMLLNALCVLKWEIHNRNHEECMKNGIQDKKSNKLGELKFEEVYQEAVVNGATEDAYWNEMVNRLKEFKL